MSAPHISHEDLLNIDTLNDAIDYLTEIGAIEGAEISPFPLVPGSYKEKLVGVPFLILEFTIKPGVNATEYAEMIIITAENIKITLRDSSRGIFEQLKEILLQRVSAKHRNPNRALWVRNGLRVTESPYTDPVTRQDTISRRYYLDM